jgi:hypothetical protein
MMKGLSEFSPKGNFPQIISYVITPKDHKSTGKLYPFPVIIYGAI